MNLLALEVSARLAASRMLNALSDEEIHWLQRNLRGRTKSEWLAWRSKYTVLIADYLRRFPGELSGRDRDPKLQPLLKLAAWQLCLEAEVLFQGVRRRADRKRKYPLTPFGLAALAIEELSVAQHVPAFWPFEIGSPFRK